MKTKDQLAEEVAVEVGEDWADAAVKAQFRKWVDWAYRRVLHLGRLPRQAATHTITLATGVATYSVDLGILDIRVAQGVSGSTLLNLAYEPLTGIVRKKQRNLLDTGKPVLWEWEGYDTGTLKRKIRVWPVPSSSYGGVTITLYTFDAAVDLANGDTIPADEPLLDVIHDGVRYQHALDTGVPAMIQARRTDFVELGLQPLGQRYVAPGRGGSRLDLNAQDPSLSLAPASNS